MKLMLVILQVLTVVAMAVAITPTTIILCDVGQWVSAVVWNICAYIMMRKYIDLSDRVWFKGEHNAEH